MDPHNTDSRILDPHNNDILHLLEYALMSLYIGRLTEYKVFWYVLVAKGEIHSSYT